ncbi:MAG TPA: putative LPS assembly protein LptD [Candidatus Kryptonia bacterium]
MKESFIILLILIACSSGNAQDTTAVKPKAPADTTTSKNDIDSLVTYSAMDSVVYSISTRQMILYKKGDMKYKDFKLDAGEININWDTSILTAEGIKDTSDKTVEEPIFNDAGEVYQGSHVTYDFKTQRGRVNVANTEIDKNYYHGQYVKKFAKDVLYVDNGRFTTCDKTDPDFYFQSSRMKLVVNDRIVAEPIIFYIQGVPIFALPFGVFPSKAGRRSGIITPSFGESANSGRYLSHIGYFWAINDYSDLTTTADWYTRGGYVLRSGLRYSMRYYFIGNIYGAYSDRTTGEPSDPYVNPSYLGRTEDKEWNLQFTHDQTIDPETRLVANFNMSSGNYFKTTSYDYNEILQQNLVSDATLFRTWEGSGNSMSINIHRDQNLQNGSISANLPSLSFSHSQSYPFKTAEHENALPDQLSWYELIGYSYSGSFLNTTAKTFNTTDSTFDRSASYGLHHSISISAAPKAGVITISPFVSFSDNMYPSRMVVGSDFMSYQGRDSTVYVKQRGFYNVGYFNTGVSASTRLFGIMQPNILGITAFRHTLQPSLTFTYQPDFSKPFWNYYGQYTSVVNGSVNKYSYFQGSSYLFGGAPAGTGASLGVGITNNFEMKTRTSDTSQAENKIQLLNLGMNFNYNFAADSLRLSELGLSYRTNIANKIDIGGSSSFNFYKFDPGIGTRVNQFLWSSGHTPDMTDFELSVSTNLQGQKKKRESTQAPSEDSVKAEKQYNNFYQQVEEPDLNIPWNLNLGFDYGISKSDPRFPSKHASLRFDLGFNLTENWKIGFTGGYDIIQKQVEVPTVTVYRDLHCWEMNLRWNPIGYYRGFNLEIRIKAPQLQDIKITKREDTLVGE